MTLGGESLESMVMSRHQLEKGKADTEMSQHNKQLQQSNYVRHPMLLHHNNMAATSVEEGKDYIV